MPNMYGYGIGSIWAEEPIRCKQTVAPTEYPVSVAEAKLNARADDSSIEDSAFSRWIAAMTEKAQGALGGKQIITATRALYLSRFPCGRAIALPYPPLATVTSVVYLDENGDSQTFSSASYQVDTVSEPGRVVLHPDYSWPTTQYGMINAVTVTYTCGYGAASAVPNSIKDAILAAVTYRYEHRGDDEMRTDGAIDTLLSEMLSTEMMLV